MNPMKERSSFHCRRSKLFVPSTKTSVIKHTNDFQQYPQNTQRKSNDTNEKFDSGIDSWDEVEEETRKLDHLVLQNQNESCEPAAKIPKLTFDKIIDPDVEKLHSTVSPVTLPILTNFKPTVNFETMNKPPIDRPVTDQNNGSGTVYDSSRIDLSYLFQLYENADEGRLKTTILKLIRNVADDECQQLTNIYGTMARKPINFGIDNLLSKESVKVKKPLSLQVPSHLETRPHSDSEAYSTYPSPTADLLKKSDDVLTNYRRSFTSDVSMPLYQSSDEMISKSKQITDKQSLQCEYCHKQFSHKNAWQRHLLTHKGKRTHKCTQCSRSFYEQSSYLRHLQSHNGEKAHKCEECSMAFSKRSALEVHIRTHTGERPFKCKFCGKGFSISGNLHRHVLIHTGHRPYKCGKCPRAFNNPSHLARHISSFHT